MSTCTGLGFGLSNRTAKSTLRFLDRAQNSGINTNNINGFLNNQQNLRKVKHNDRHNANLCEKHKIISSNLMSLKVRDQSLVVGVAAEAAARSRGALRETAPSSKSFRNAVHQLNLIAKDIPEDLERKNEKKLEHIYNKQNAPGEISMSIKTRHRYESKYPNLSIYKESDNEDQSVAEEIHDVMSKEKPIIIGDIEADDDEKEVIKMNPKKPIQLEPKLSDFKVEMESCFCKTRWSIMNAEKYNTSHLEGIPWEELEESDKQKFIEKEAEMRRIFSREYKCVKLNNLRVTDSRFNAHISLPKALPQDKEIYINLRRETFTKTMKKYLKKYETKKVKMNISKKQFRGYKKLKKRLKNHEFKLAQTDKSNHLAIIENESYNKREEEHTSKDLRISLDKAMDLAKD